MAYIDTMNVYKGPDSMKKYLNPDIQPPLPLVEIPDSLNPFREEGVRIYAKMMTALPCQNVKALPALNMLEKAAPKAEQTIVEPSSGSTVSSISMISRALYNITDVQAYVSNKTEESRLRTLQFYGLKVVLYGGPSQPNITDPRGQVQKCKRMGEESDEIYNPGQYENIYNPEAHTRWTGPQILKQLPEVNVFCAGMGSGGVITGTGSFFKESKPSVTIVGVCNETGDSIPGPRPLPLIDNMPFPWKDVTDTVKVVKSTPSYSLSLALSREGLICGPSSGMALQGLLDFLRQQKESGTLANYADPSTGDISCVFPCCDLPYQYMDTYFQKLGPESFHPIVNLDLKEIDQGTYDHRWEIPVANITQHNGGQPYNLCRAVEASHACPNVDNILPVLDLRQRESFACEHICGSLNVTLSSCFPETPSPFDDIATLKSQFRDLEYLATELSTRSDFNVAGPSLIICYSGETARLACSIFRRRNIEAYSLKGGVSGHDKPHL